MYRYYESSTQLTPDGEVVIPTTDETSRNALGYLLAGGIAGAVSRTCTAPFDRLKIYLITHSGTPENPLTFSNAVKSIYNYGGWKSFFCGNGLNVMKIVPESAIKFYSYESCKEVFANILACEDKDSIPTSARFAAGGIAGICAQFCIYPVETLKTRVMASNNNTSYKKKISPSTTSTTSYNNISSISNPKLAAAYSTSATASTTNGFNTGSIIKETAKQMYARGGIRAFWPGLVSSWEKQYHCDSILSKTIVLYYRLLD
jgi:solute carrier family 25 phosphate transporter 23/24/25/41